MHPNICLSRLGEILGIELSLDEQQQTLLIIDNRLFLSLRFINNQWIVYGMVNQLTEEEKCHSPAQYWQNLLTLNLTGAETGDGSLCFFEKTNALLYIDSPRGTINNGDMLYQYLDNFTQRLEKTILLAQSSQYLI